MHRHLWLLDWTGQQIRTNKVGTIPNDCAPILERLELNAETWLDVVKNFRKRFHNEAELLKSRQSFRSTRRVTRTSSSASPSL